MTKYVIVLLFIDFGLSQLSVEGKRIYNKDINEYYSYNQFVEILNNDRNFINSEKFRNFKSYVHNKKRKRTLYCFSLMCIAGLSNPTPDIPHQDILLGRILPLSLSYYTYFSYKRHESLFYVVQQYNNIYSDGEINYEKYPGPKIVKSATNAYKKTTPEQRVFGTCIGTLIGGVIITPIIWRWIWGAYY